MDIFQFIASLVGSLAWPCAAVGMSIFLRKPVIELLRRTESAEGFGAKLTFGERIEAVEEIVHLARDAQHPLPAADDVPPIPSPEPEALRELTDELSRSSATGSIVASWNELERGLHSIAKINNLGWSEHNIAKNITNFRDLGILSRELFEAVNSLRLLRNEVIHGRNARPSLSEAEAFRRTVKEIVETARLNASNLNYR